MFNVTHILLKLPKTMETICEAEALTSQQAKGQRIRQAEIDVTGRSASRYENAKVV